MGLVYRFSLVVARLLFWALGSLEVHDREKVPLKGSLILTPNHLSYLDPPLVGVSLPRYCFTMAKDYLFKSPLMAWWITRLNVFPVKEHGVDRAALKRAFEVLKAGEVLVLFPEGTRSRTGDLGALQPGAATIALRTGAPIQPLLIYGTNHVLPRDAKLPRRAKIRTLFGDPIDPAPFQAMDSREEATAALTQALDAALRELREEHRRRWGE
ncbi:MAG TPA: lysophospholipid acyltransferase family protein [Armatimonadota bacterium]|jgi:1-acyl-sn-glycerol-3-phosphate acyltransferase